MCVKVSSSIQECSIFCLFYLKYLLTADLDAAVASLGLLLRKFLPQDLQLLHKVSLVFGHSQALCVFGQLGWGQRLLRGPKTTLVLHLGRMTGGIMFLKWEMEDEQSRTDGEGSTRYAWADKWEERVEGKRHVSRLHHLLKQLFKQFVLSCSFPISVYCFTAVTWS